MLELVGATSLATVAGGLWHVAGLICVCIFASRCCGAVCRGSWRAD